MENVVIVAAKRTAIGSFGGGLANITAVELGAFIIQDLVASLSLSNEDIDEIILGQVLTAGVGQNPARQALIKAGLSADIPATTLNVVCGSGLRSIQLATSLIQSGQAECIIAGGQESMSQSPYLLPNMRYGQRMGDTQAIDSMLRDGLQDAYHHYHMGITAENIAEKYHINRLDQDKYALSSQEKASAAQKAGKFIDEITPIFIPQRKGDVIEFKEDEYIKHGVTLEKIQKLKPAFKQEGTVTAANASGINDGAACVVLMSERKAHLLGLPIMGIIRSMSLIGCEPEMMGLGPIWATQKALSQVSWTVDDLDLIEANEAFAVQALAVTHELKWDMQKVNVNGGAIALGHPIGASGCRILVTLLHEMQRRSVSKGLATLCIGGGMGIAVTIER